MLNVLSSAFQILSARNAGLQLICQRASNPEKFADRITFYTCFLILVSSNSIVVTFHSALVLCNVTMMMSDIRSSLSVRKIVHITNVCNSVEHRDLRASFPIIRGQWTKHLPDVTALEERMHFQLIKFVWKWMSESWHEFDDCFAGSIIGELFLQQTSKLFDWTCPVTLNVSATMFKW
jgi:hypothetical protein